MVNKTYPQDDGSSQNVSAEGSDYADAANLSAHAHTGNAVDYVVAGHTLSVNFTDGTVDISAGQSRIAVESNQSKDHGDGTVVWQETTVVVRKDAETLDLNAGQENHIWVDARMEEDDNAQFAITEGSAPLGEVLRIGVVDTSEGSTEHVNREPNGTYNDLTVEGLASIEQAAISRLTDSIDGNGESITGLSAFSATNASVSTEPTQSDHVARQAELDEQFSHGDQQRLESGGEDELNLAGLEGETATPQPPMEHGNSAHAQEFVSPANAETALADDTLHTKAIAVPSSDLSSISLSASDDGGLFHHDGSSTISIVDGNATTATGYYRYRHSDSTWVPIGEEAMLLDGYNAESFALIDGDTFSGPVNIETVTENSLLYLKAEDPNYYPEIGMGNEFDTGIKMRYYEMDNELWFGNFNSTDGFAKVIGFDLTDGQVITNG